MPRATRREPKLERDEYKPKAPPKTSKKPPRLMPPWLPKICLTVLRYARIRWSKIIGRHPSYQPGGTTMQRTAPTKGSRRQFLTTSAAALGASLAVSRHAHAAGGDLLKIGLIGCGGRGTGAASQALRADKNCKLWAMAD